MLDQEYILSDVWRGKLEFSGLKHKIIKLAELYQLDTILIEDVGPGQHMMQELIANPVEDVPRPIGIKPDRDKVSRIFAASTSFEAGQVYLRGDNPPWLANYLNELLGFPNTKHDDVVDSTSSSLNG